MLQLGHLDRDHDLVWHAGVSDWTPATQIPGLLPAASVAMLHTPIGLSAPETPGGTAADSALPRVARCRWGLMAGLGVGALIPGLPGLGLILFSVFEANSGPSGDHTRVMVAAMGGTLLLLLALGLLVAAVVQFSIALYRAWFVLQPFGVRTTPGLAVGLCFVPVVAQIWCFVALWGWSQDYNRAMNAHEDSYPGAPRVTPGLFLSFCVVQAVALPFQLFLSTSEEALPILGLLVLSILVLVVMASFQLCAAVNYFAALHATTEEA